MKARLARLTTALEPPYRFLTRLLEAADRRGLLAQAGSLAWVTTLSLVPLLAAFSFVGAQLFDQYRERILAIARVFWPWPEAAVLARIEELLAEAQSVREIGALGFLIVTLGLFDAVEKSVNRLWGISRERSLRRRLASLALLLFWGPIVIGLGITLVLELRSRWLAPWASSLLLTALVFGALVMVFRSVPATRVRMPAALAGAGVTTVLLELLRRGFGAYATWWLDAGPNVYGSLALMVLFLLSIHLVWLALLLGTLTGAVIQRGKAATGTPRADAWVGLATMLLLGRRLISNQAPLAAEALPLEIGCDPDVVEASVKVLAAANLVHHDERSGLIVLTSSPYRLLTEEVLALYPETTIDPTDPALRSAVDTVVELVTAQRDERLQGATLASLLDGAATADVAKPAESG